MSSKQSQIALKESKLLDGDLQPFVQHSLVISSDHTTVCIHTYLSLCEGLTVVKSSTATCGSGFDSLFTIVSLRFLLENSEDISGGACVD